MARCLGGGASGSVYEMVYNGERAAVKMVPKHYFTERHLDREWRIYQEVNHNNVVKVLGKPWLADSMWYIPLEFIDGETLEKANFDKGKSNIQLSLSTKATVITGMCEGLHYLHRKSIIHRDLKPENIMVEYGTLRAVIIDLGLAKFYQGTYSNTEGGNDAYSAPEIFVGHRRDMCNDVWAMGKIIGEVLLDERLPTVGLSAAIVQDRLYEHPYCEPVGNMLDGSPISRASMAAVIGALRDAGRACRRGSSRQVSLPLERHKGNSGHSNQALVPNTANLLSAFGAQLPAPIPLRGKVKHTEFEVHSDTCFTVSQLEIEDNIIKKASHTKYDL